jgi:hypothetical protein
MAVSAFRVAGLDFLYGFVKLPALAVREAELDRVWTVQATALDRDDHCLPVGRSEQGLDESAVLEVCQGNRERVDGV